MSHTLTVLPEPTTKHGPATRRVTLSRQHEGQIVTPIVNAWRLGKKRYLVQLSQYDASDRTFAEPEEFTGDYWTCIRWLASQGVHADIDAV